MATDRPPPFILLIHDGRSGREYVPYLIAAGFRVAELQAEEPDRDLVDQTSTIGPDLILLDYTCDGETVMRLKADPRTAGLPILALAEVLRIRRTPVSTRKVPHGGQLPF
jgi:DNA-binding response OmpR family regulator